MTGRRQRLVAAGAWLVVVLTLVIGVWLGVGYAPSEGDDSAGATVFIPLIVLAFATVGLMLVLRLPQNRIGWLYLTSGVLGGLYVASYVFTQAAIAHGWGDPDLIATTSAALYFPWILTMVALPILLFPDGRPPSRRWRWVLWVILSTMLVAFAANLFTTDPVVGFDELYERFDIELFSPFGVTVAQRILDSAALVPLTAALLLTSLLGPPAALVYRFRRSRGIERQQLKWLAFSASLAAIGLTVTYTVGEISDSAWVSAVTGVALISVLGIPASTGLAVARYRLFDIDHLINRTVVYGGVIAVLALVFIAGAVWVPTVLPGSDNSLAVAATTLLVFFLFQPVRKRVQSVVDRRFYRSRYQAQQVTDQFAAHLRDDVDLELVTGRLVDVVDRTMQPRTVSLWIKDRS